MAIERAPEVEELIREMNRAYKDGDVGFILGHASKDPTAMLVGTDPGEIGRGPDEVASLLKGENAERSADSPQWSPDEIVAHREGDVAWATAIGPFEFPGGPAIQARAAGVVRREDGEWKFVSWVFSFGVPNQALEPGSPVLEGLAAAKV